MRVYGRFPVHKVNIFFYFPPQEGKGMDLDSHGKNCSNVHNISKQTTLLFMPKYYSK